MLSNAKRDVVKINEYAESGQNQFICAQDIEQKQNSDVIQGP